jgi:hypothetical protein
MSPGMLDPEVMALCKNDQKHPRPMRSVSVQANFIQIYESTTGQKERAVGMQGLRRADRLPT